MMQWNEPNGRSTNAEERERLGWITVPEVTQASQNVELDDFITTGNAYKYDLTPENSSDYEYLYFESHQKLSIYDDATKNSTDKGLIVLHDKAANQTSEFVRYLLTDGDWDFENVYPYAIEHPSPSNASILPVWEKVNPDPSNFGDNMSRRRYVFIQNSPNTNDTTIRQFEYALKEDGNITVEPFFQGVNITSTFNPGKYSTLSKITNPKTREFNSSNGPDFYMNVVSQTGNKLYVDFEVNHDPYTINENTDWDRQIFLDNSASISNSAVLTLAPETGIYSNTTGGIDVNSTGKIFVENDGSRSTVTIKDSVTVDVNSGGFLEIDDATSFPNRTEIIVEGTLNINSGATLDIGDYGLIFVQNGGQVNVDPNATIIEGVSAEFNAGNQGTVVFTGNTIFSGGSSCLMTLTGGEMRFEGTLTMENGSFIQSHGSGGGTYVFEGNVNLYDGGNSSGYVMDLFYGTEMQMDYSVDITVHNGSKIRSVGTLANPVTFIYRGTYIAGSDSWDTMELRGDGNIFEYTILEHGVTPLYFRSKNNVVEYSTIRNNTNYGIRTESDYSGGWSSVKITDSNIHDNGSHGVYARNTHMGIQYTNIKDNGGDGVYAYNATIGNPNTTGSEYFRSNDIQDNSSNAIQLAYNATLYDGYSSTDGNNNFGHNGSHEVYLSSSSARWYDANGGSYSAVLDNTSSKFVYNLAQTTSGESTVSWTVGMENNAWNYATPSSSKFFGQVDYTPYQTGQMFGSLGPRGSGTPSAFNGGELPQLVLSAAAVESQTSGLNSQSEKDTYLEHTREIDKLVNSINGDPRDRMVAKNLNGLVGYYNQLPESKKPEFAHVPGMLGNFIADKQLAREVSFGMDGSRLTSETALMLQIHQQLQDGDAQGALNNIGTYKATFSNLDIKRELGFVEASALEQLGQYNEAIGVYQELATLSRLGIDAENTTTDYKTLIATMESLRDEESGKDGASRAQTRPDKVKEIGATDEKQLPTSFALNEAYPNPFNPSTVLSFDLPETGKVKVEVFNIAGQLVSVLTNQRFEAGSHSLQFNADGLASGVYLVRANLAGTIQSQKVTLIK